MGCAPLASTRSRQTRVCPSDSDTVRAAASMPVTAVFASSVTLEAAAICSAEVVTICAGLRPSARALDSVGLA